MSDEQKKNGEYEKPESQKVGGDDLEDVSGGAGGLPYTTCSNGFEASEDCASGSRAKATTIQVLRRVRGGIPWPLGRTWIHSALKENRSSVPTVSRSCMRSGRNFSHSSHEVSTPPRERTQGVSPEDKNTVSTKTRITRDGK